jgi:hypothetical protein
MLPFVSSLVDLKAGNDDGRLEQLFSLIASYLEQNNVFTPEYQETISKVREGLHSSDFRIEAICIKLLGHGPEMDEQTKDMVWLKIRLKDFFIFLLQNVEEILVIERPWCVLPWCMLRDEVVAASTGPQQCGNSCCLKRTPFIFNVKLRNCFPLKSLLSMILNA